VGGSVSSKSNFPDHAQRIVKVVLATTNLPSEPQDLHGAAGSQYNNMESPLRIGSYICYHLLHHRPRVVAHIATISLGVALNTTRRRRRRRVDIPKVR
jgi:hypothetical protein